MMKQLLLLLVLVPTLHALAYEVSSTINNPKLGDSPNLRCKVLDIDANSKDSIIVWYQERDIYQALIGRVDGRQPIGRVVASCRTRNGKSEFEVNSQTVLPFPAYVKLRVCLVDDFRISIVKSGMQHIGEWWCYYTPLDMSGDPPIKVTGELVEPTNNSAMMDIRSTGGKVPFYISAPAEKLPGKTGGVVGQSLAVDCPADTALLTAPIGYSWSKVGGATLANKQQILTLDSVKMADAGEYECVAESGGTTESGKVEVIPYTIAEMDLFVEPSEFVGIVAPESNPNILTAVSYAQKPGAPQPDVVDSYTFSLLGGENLRNFRYGLSFTRAYHGGKFYLEYYSYLPGVQPFPYVTKSRVYTIELPFPVDSVSLTPTPGLTHIRTVEGRGVDVLCSAEGGGNPPEVLYFYKQLADGRKQALGANGIGVQWVVQEQPKKVIQSRILEEFSRADNGSILQCVADGDNGTKIISNLTLEVYWLPGVFNFSMSTERAVIDAGSEVTFECYSEGGYPDDVTITVKYGDKVLKTNKGIVRLYDVSDADSGHYTCTLTSTAGQISKDIYMAVQKEPLTVREAIGPLIMVIMITVMVVAAIAAFFLFFMCRGNPEKRKEKQKPKPNREPRFRPTKQERTLRKQKTPPPGKDNPQFTDITPARYDIPDSDSPLGENGLNHVNPPSDTKPDHSAEEEVMVDVNEIALEEVPPSPPASRPEQVEVDVDGTLDENMFPDGLDFKFVDDDTDGGTDLEDNSTDL